jgi:hypothetical protein
VAGKAVLALLITLTAAGEIWYGYELRLIPLAVFLGCTQHPPELLFVDPLLTGRWSPWRLGGRPDLCRGPVARGDR